MATDPAALSTPATDTPYPPMGSRSTGSCARSASNITPHPPAWRIPTTGSVTRQPSIRTPWRKSEYATALKPPTVV